jgi:4-amino-4-deoxy-L-arabinose transferase-like glycosyltransferase
MLPDSQSGAASLQRPSRRIWLAALLLLAAFLIASADLQRESFWNDEAWTAWAVRSPYLADTLARVRGDVHPPLYFLLLHGWVRVGGESVYAIRLLSTLLGMVGLAATYALGKRLFDSWAGLLALVVLGTASFFVYYTREARMYTLLLSLGVLAAWAYLRWEACPTLRRAGVYAVLMAALLYTHYAGGLVIATHVLHLLVMQVSARIRGQGSRHHPLRLLMPYAGAFILYLPWLPIFLNQMRANPNGPLAIPLPTDWGTVAALVLILTSAHWGWLVVPFVLGRAIPLLRRYASAILLLVIWLLLTPVTLLALNAWVAPVYQVRYAIAMLPAGALLVAYGLRHVYLPAWIRTRRRMLLQIGLTLFLLGALAYTQLTMYGELWPGKAPWGETIAHMLAARKPLEPTITDFAPYSPAAYYDRQMHIRQGIALDLSWRLHSAAEIRGLLPVFAHEPSVWVALPINTAKTWHIVAGLNANRHVGYRSSLVNMIFYRFDSGAGEKLRFRFGDLLRYAAGPDAAQQFVVQPGKPLCVNLSLAALTDVDNSYSAGLHLVDITGTTTAAQWDGGVGAAKTGDRLPLSPCLTVPANTPPGHYHLELVVYNWSTLKRLLVIEDSGAALSWGDVLMLAAVDVPAP